MSEHEFLLYLPEYAAGVLTGSEKTRLESHLQNGCDICEPELIIFRETLGRLPYAAPNQKLNPDLKQRIWKKIESESPVKQKTSFNWKPMLAIAAMIALAILATVLYVQRNDAVYQLEKAVTEAQKQLRQQQQEINWLRDPSVQLAMLTGLAAAPQAQGKMLWNPHMDRGLFYANSLPPLAKEKSYQLWVIGNGGPVSAGVFDVGPQGSAVVTITRISSPATGSLQFAVTIEPRGGVPKPTG